MFKIPGGSTQTLTIWDSNLICHLRSDSILLWQQFVDKASDATATASICEIVDQNGSEIRAKLLQLIYEVGKSITENPKTNIKFRKDFDYFWMTQFHSRPYTPSGELNNLAKVFALIEVVKTNKIKKIVFYSSNKNLVQVIKSLANCLEIELDNHTVKSSARFVSVRTRAKSLAPRPALAVLALATQLKTSLSLKPNKTKMSPTSTISFFDYWYRFSESTKIDKVFSSQYWTKLVGLLGETEVNWYHNLVDQNRRKEFTEATDLLNNFNLHKRHQHQITDSQFNFKILMRTICDYFKLVSKSLPSNKYKSSFTEPIDEVNFWPLMRREWLNSLRGYEALINCLRFNRLESILSRSRHQSLGFYLIENQPWEMALIHLWKKYNHGKLIGVAHSTVRFWDLRLMSNVNQFSTNSKMPRPDQVAVNGPLARQALLESGYPIHELVNVEALMYLHLRKIDTPHQTKSKLRILVATDYLESATQAQMKLLQELVSANPDRFEILLKPHWSQSLRNLEIDAQIVSGLKDISSFFDQVDVLYCSTITSAVIDGACAGIPVVQCLDPLSLNLSPLRNHPAIKTVKTADELLIALTQVNQNSVKVSAKELFNLDDGLKGWRDLLQI